MHLHSVAMLFSLGIHRQIFLLAARMVFLAGCIALCMTTLAQQNSTKPNLAFKHIRPDALAPLEYITAITQDAQGFIWIAGRNGLAKFDGYELTFYKHDKTDRTTILSNYVRSIYLAKDGTLWFGTNRGLTRYHYDTDSFTPYLNLTEPEHRSPLNDVQVITEGLSGDLWVGTRRGLFQLSVSKGSFTSFQFESDEKFKGDYRINDIIVEKDGDLWIGNRSTGLTHFDISEYRFTHFRSDPNDPKSISDNDVRTLLLDKNDNLWIGTYEGGVSRLLPDRETFVFYPQSHEGQTIRDTWKIIQDNQDRIWIATGQGLILWSPEEDSFYRYQNRAYDPKSMSSVNVRALFEDRDSNLWLGLFPHGVNIVDRRASVFHNYYPSDGDTNAILGRGVRALFEDNKQNLWIGTGEGLSIIQHPTKKIQNIPLKSDIHANLSNRVVMSLAQDDEGDIWFGNWAFGVTRYNTTNKRFTQYQAENQHLSTNIQGKPLIGNQPWYIYKDSNNTLWLATNRGLNRYNPKTDDFDFFFIPQQNKTGLYCRVIFEDSNKNLWIGTTRGLALFDKQNEALKLFPHIRDDENTLSDSFVLSILEDRTGRLWLGTKGGGITYLDYSDPNEPKFIREKRFNDTVITGLVEDDDGTVWASTHNGLLAFHTDSTIKQFNKRHGLPGNLFNRNAFIKRANGHFAVGSTDGLTLFDPVNFWRNKDTPRTVITGLHVLNEAQPLGNLNQDLFSNDKTADIVLTHKEPMVTFKYAALNYSLIGESQYAYRLTGFDEGWHQVGQTRQATYTNLDAGIYLFQVKASNGDGVWSDRVSTVKVEVLPPPHKTKSAYMLYGFFLVLAAYLSWASLKRQQEHKASELENRNLQELHKLKDQVLANTSHELRTPLNGIVGLSEALLDGHAATPLDESQRHFVESIHFSGNRLSLLVNDILDSAKLQSHDLSLQKSKIGLKAFIDSMFTLINPLVRDKNLALVNQCKPSCMIYADEKRMQQIMFNLLGNAIKFTPEGMIKITSDTRDGNVVIHITDTGVGIPQEQIDKIFESFEQVDSHLTEGFSGTGLGLTITKQLIIQHGGEISVESTEGKGSTFSITLPQAPDLPTG